MSLSLHTEVNLLVQCIPPYFHALIEDTHTCLYNMNIPCVLVEEGVVLGQVEVAVAGVGGAPA